MANIIFRGGAVPTSANAAIGVAPTAKGLPLTNDEIDKNLFALNLGPTIGTTTISPGATSLTLAGLTSVTATSFIGTASNVTTNANLTGDVTSVGNATTLANTAVTAGSYGSTTAIPVITVDSKGRLTAASTSAITVGDGALTITTKTAGATNTDVTLELSGAYSANSSTATTIKAVVGPALTNLAAFMTTAGAGFIKRTGQDTYAVDTNTYLTSVAAPGDGALTVASTAALTNVAITLALSGVYSANTSTARSLDFKVGPALTNLATLMTTAGAGFIRRGATADTYTIDTNTYLTSVAAPGDGALTVSSSAGATASSVALSLSGVYSANTSTARSLNFTVGPALTNLATLMTTAGVGFIRRTGQDTYAVDTNTYLTSYTETRLNAPNSNTTFVSGDISFIGGGVTTVTRAGNIFTVSSTDTDTNTITTIGANALAGVSGDVKLVAGTNVSISRNGQNITIDSSYTDTDTNTTYNHLAVTATDGAFLRLNGSNSVNDDVKFVSDGATTVSYVDDNTIKISSTSVGDGALTIATRTAGATNSDVTLELSGAYSANTSTARTIKAVVGPALTALTTFMAASSAGFVKRTGADTYGIDTSTYLTSSSGVTTIGANSVAGVSGAINFNNGTNITISRSGQNFTIASLTELPIKNDAGSLQFYAQSGTAATDGIRFAASGAASVSFDLNYNKVTFSSTNTTYTASTGLTLTGTAFSVNYGATSTTACVGNDSRLSDTRAHNGTALSATTGTFSSNVGVTGTIIASGDITAHGTPSDIRLKENIVKLDNCLSKVEQLNGYSFNYIGKTDKMIGVIAQELEVVAPELVYEFEDLQTKEMSKAVRYGQITALLIEAIKELNAKVTDLQNQLAINK